MEKKFDKKQLFEAIQGLSYVTTTSGPVVPAKSKQIEVMTKQILGPITKPQDNEKHDKRLYDKNPALTSSRPFMTIKDIYGKVIHSLTEATSKTADHSMRLNLSSIDMEETHCKFIVNRHDTRVLVEMYYPNVNKNISIKLLTESGNSKLYEVSLDSDQFRMNFGYTILKSIDALNEANGYSVTDDIENADILDGMGTAMRDVNDTIIQPSAMIRESVDAGLSKLLKICNDAAMFEAEGDAEGDEQAAGAGNFEAPAGEDPSNINGMSGPDEMVAQTPGSVNAENENPEADDMVNFRDALIKLMSGNSVPGVDSISNIDTDTTSNSDASFGLGTLEKLIAQNAHLLITSGQDTNLNPVSVDGILHGGVGIINGSSAIEKANAFLNYYSELDTDVTLQQMDEFVKFINNPGEDVNLSMFADKMKQIFGDTVYKDQNNQNMSVDSIKMNTWGDGNDSANDYDNGITMDFDAGNLDWNAYSDGGSGSADAGFSFDSNFGASSDNIVDATNAALGDNYENPLAPDEGGNEEQGTDVDDLPELSS